jgi:hypothetical protein
LSQSDQRDYIFRGTEDRARPLSRVYNDDEAKQWKRDENLPAYWNHVLDIIEGVGGGNALGKITRLMDFKFTSEGSFQQDHHRYMAAVQALHDNYPGSEGKERFYQLRRESPLRYESP